MLGHTTFSRNTQQQQQQQQQHAAAAAAARSMALQVLPF
jgi:hypothetical protein